MPRTRSQSIDKLRRKKRAHIQSQREREDSEVKAKKRKIDAERKAEARSKETSEEKEGRKFDNAKREALRRQKEPVEISRSRQKSNAMNTARTRANITQEATAHRQVREAARNAYSRAHESAEDRRSRLAAISSQAANKRARETPEKRKHQNILSTARTASARAKESPGRTKTRQNKDAVRKSNTRKQSNTNIPSINEISNKFQENVKKGPDYVCTCCHRLMYRQGVVKFDRDKYSKTCEELSLILPNSVLHPSAEKSIWICNTCHRTLKKGRMPVQAKANGLTLSKIPPELSDLNDLEIRLLSKRIPFMKMMALPRGKQKGIHGPAVNVPARLDTVCHLLPRIPSNSEIIPMKLKRKLCYKGHYMYAHVRPEVMKNALEWLKANNKLYEDVKINKQWQTTWTDEEPDMWAAMTGTTMLADQKPGDSHEESQSNTGESTKEVKEADEGKSETNCVSPEIIFVRGNELIQSVTPEEKNTTKHLEVLCLQRNFSIEHVTGDGNCFFHAVSKQLKRSRGQNITHSKLRHDLVKHMEENPTVRGESYRDFVDLEDPTISRHTQKYISNLPSHDDAAELRWQLYLQRMEEGAWADHLAVQAMADMLNTTIKIIATLNPNTPDIKSRSDNGTDTMYLGLIGEHHYVSLVQEETDRNQEVSHRTDNDNRKISEQKIDSEEFIENEYKIESEAFAEGSKLRGLPLETCLQPDDFASNQIVSIAPSENQKPVNILTDLQFEEMAFPHYYPNGTGGFSCERPKPITMRKYFNQRLLDVDGRFGKNVEYLLASQYAVEQKQLNDITNIVLRQTSGRMYRGMKITAGILKDKQKLQQMVERDDAYRMLKQVRGTPAYWERVHYDVLAMIRQLGIPTWFLTLSAADMKWPDVIQTIGRQYGEKYSDEDVAKMDWEQKTNILKRNPVTAARHFQYRLDLFWKDFLMCSANPIGEITDYMIRIEFQARGSPHAHCIIWIKDAPKYGQDPEEEVITFIEKHQTCRQPTEDETLCELVKLQSHIHSSSCLRRGICRFGIPKVPSPVTLIAKEIDNSPEANTLIERGKHVFKEVRQKVQQLKTNDESTLEDILRICDISMNDYLELLRYSKNGNVLVLKRSIKEMNINHYNPHILKAWKANMDIQYILDAYACVMYVTSYMMKNERAMGELLRQVCRECRGDDIRTQLRRLGSTFLNHREVSAQEAAYRLLSLPLNKKSRKVLFINTDSKEHRASIVKPLSVIENMDDEDEDLYHTSLIDRYAARPDEMENVTLAEFGANFNVSYNEPTENDHTPASFTTENIDTTKKIYLKNGLGQMYRRKKKAVIRFHKFNKQKEPEKYYRSQLMLYTPWRNEETDILGQSETFLDQYKKKMVQLKEIESMFSTNTDSLEDAIDDLQQYGPPEDLWAHLAPTAEQSRLQEEEEGNLIENEISPQDLQDNIDLLEKRNNSSEDIVMKYNNQVNVDMFSQEEYCRRVRQLNAKQRNILNIHRRWCKNLVEAVRQGRPEPEGYHLFVSGSGGTGKTHLISLLQHDTIKLLRNLPHVHPEDVLCLLTAFTGTAAFQIGGMTIHSALLFGKQRKSTATSGISSDNLNTLRNKLGSLKVMIIDEISLVGSDLFYQIHKRLDIIKGNTNPNVTFGNVTMIVVGDLFQLQPVKQSYVFELPSDDYAKLQEPLWCSFQLAELTDIMRQKDDASFAELLNRVRNSTCTESDIQVLQSREITCTDSEDSYPKDAYHVFVDNRRVNEYNMMKINNLRKNNVPIFIVKSNDSKKDLSTAQVAVKMSSKAADTGGLEESLEIAKGARVMLTHNLDVSDGLVNGACGTVVNITSVNGEVVHILVEFDSLKVGQNALKSSQYKNDFPKAVPISKYQASFYVGRRKSAEATRVQFPLRLAWASTIHKVQGMTLDRIVVSMEGRFNAGQAYVAFSRVRSLHGLYIRHFKASKIHTNKKIMEEMDRLRDQHVQPVPEPAFLASPSIQYLKLVHLNVRGFLTHLNDLEMDPWLNKADILCFCESFLSEKDQLSNVYIAKQNMTIQRVNRKESRTDGIRPSGGILIALKHVFTIKNCCGISKNCTEVCALQLCSFHHADKLFNVVAVYRSPTSPVQSLIEFFATYVENHCKTNPTIVLGDFNEDISGGQQGRISKYLTSKGFSQLIKTATRDTGTVLDHAYVNFDVRGIQVHVRDIYFSDHDMISISIPFASI